MRSYNNVISFQILKVLDSVLVRYNDNDSDIFVCKNIVFYRDECCGDIVSNFEIEFEGKTFCNECTNKIWEIKK